MRKKTISLILTIIIAFMTFPVTGVSADSSDDLIWSNRLMFCYNSSKDTSGCVFFCEMDNRYNKTKDLFGHTYGEGDGFFIHFGSEYSGDFSMSSDFYLNGNWDYLETGLAVVESALQDETAEVLFYGDDKLIYKQNVTNRTSPDDKIKIDLKGVKWLTVEVKLKNKGMIHRYIALTNPTIYKVNHPGWLQIEEGKWYYVEKGGLVDGWKKINGIWYYFADCLMYIGWINIDGVYYYFNDNGAMQTGWLNYSGYWYFLSLMVQCSPGGKI